jgi:hypothetical protein
MHGNAIRALEVTSSLAKARYRGDDDDHHHN